MPLTMRTIYADNNATPPIAPEVFEAMTPFFTEDYFNPSSMYEPARRTAAAIVQARRQIAGHFGIGDPKQILFTSCATESNNAAINAGLKAHASPYFGRNRYLAFDGQCRRLHRKHHARVILTNIV